MNKENIMEHLEELKINGILSDKECNEYLNRLNLMNEAQISTFLGNNGIKDKQSLYNFVNENKNRNIRNEDKFERLNEIVGFGVSNDTMHIHVMPENLEELTTKDGRLKLNLSLIDSLEKIKVLLNDEKYHQVKQVYAVSGILRKSFLKWFDDLGFDTKGMDIKSAKEDKELSKFYERFKDKKYLGRAFITKDVLMSKKWEENKEKQKHELEEKLGINKDKVLDENNENSNEKPKKEDMSSSFKSELAKMRYSDEEIIENSDLNSKQNELTKNKEDKSITDNMI